MSTEEKGSLVPKPGCWVPILLTFIGIAALQMLEGTLSIRSMLLPMAFFVGLLGMVVAIMLPFVVAKAVHQSVNQYRLPMDPGIALTSADDPDAAPGFATTVDDMAAVLTPLGFSPPAFVKSQSAVGPVVTALMMNARTRTLARLLSTLGGKPILRIVGPSFASGFVDETQHQTLCLSEDLCRRWTVPRSSDATRLSLLDVKDAALGVRLHEAAVDQRLTNRRPPISSDPVELQRETIRRENEALVRAGMMVVDGDAYRMTYRGALRALFRMMPPFPQLRVRAARRSTAKALRELNA